MLPLFNKLKTLLFGKRFMEDPVKIQEKTRQLSKELGGEWLPADGYHAITRFDFNNGSPTFNPGMGAPLKAFFNPNTGEVKTFLARFFEKNA